MEIEPDDIDEEIIHQIYKTHEIKPNYSNLQKILDQWIKLKDDLSQINLTLTAGAPSIDSIVDAKKTLLRHLANYGDNRALIKTKTMLETTLPRIEGSIIDQTKSLIKQAERSSSIEDAIDLIEKARSNLQSLEELASTDERISRSRSNIDEKHQELDELKTALIEAQKDLHANHPHAAWKKSKRIRERFPTDPKVADLIRGLTVYRSLRSVGIVIAVLIVTIALGIGSVSLGRGIIQYIRDLTPTATFTPSPTSTQTPIPSETPIPTSTHTPVPTPTPTPMIYITTRNIYARQDCYEEYLANVRIPAGSYVTPLGVNPRRDNLGRTCLMVEYESESSTYTGWVLLEDLRSQ